MVKGFFTQMLSGTAGTISSKRMVMIFFVLLFAFGFLYNLITGKSPSPLYQEQLFEILIILFILVFGEKVVQAVGVARGKKVTSTTVLTPEQPVVTTITQTEEKQ